MMKQHLVRAARTVAATALVGALFAGEAAVAANSSPSAAVAAAPSQGAAYLRTKGEAVARNFPDQNGSALATIAPGTIVRAYRSSSGTPVFREVEVAGGFPVWVFGAYLQQTDTEGVLMVTGSRVNMRPLPELSASAMALRSKLESGNRVKMLARANKSPLFHEDWIRIQAPANAKAWITDGALEPVDAALGRARWAEVNVPLPTAPTRRAGFNSSKASSTRTASAAVSPVGGEVILDLAEADKAFQAADALESPTSEVWQDVVDAYTSVAERAPQSSITYSNAIARMEDARMKLEVAALRDELVAKRERRDEEVRQIDEFLDHQKRRRSARWDRYEERGWLESRNVGGQKRWYLVFAGATVAEVRCMSERYQLEVFDGFEIGVLGHEVVPVVQATPSTLAEARVVDIQRIEVISAKARL
jgi:hypothetical protein